MFAFFSSS